MMDEVNFIERLTKPTILLKGFKRIKKEHAACLPLNTFWIDLSLEFTLENIGEVTDNFVTGRIGLHSFLWHLQQDCCATLTAF